MHIMTESKDVACPSCDLLIDVSGMEHGDKAVCERCGHSICIHYRDGTERCIAFSFAALVFLVIANSFSFLAFKASGLENQMTLPETAWKLYEYGMPDLAFMVATFIILLPGLLTLAIFAIAIALQFHKPVFWLVPVTRWVFVLQGWCMVEVFLIGVIVSLVKIIAMADVVLGVSFWAYVAYTSLFTLSLSCLDRVHTWQAIEALMAQTNNSDEGVSGFKETSKGADIV